MFSKRNTTLMNAFMLRLLFGQESISNASQISNNTAVSTSFSNDSNLNLNVSARADNSRNELESEPLRNHVFRLIAGDNDPAIPGRQQSKADLTEEQLSPDSPKSDGNPLRSRLNRQDPQNDTVSVSIEIPNKPVAVSSDTSVWVVPGLIIACILCLVIVVGVVLIVLV